MVRACPGHGRRRQRFPFAGLPAISLPSSSTRTDRKHTSELQSPCKLVCRLRPSSTLFPDATLFRSVVAVRVGRAAVAGEVEAGEAREVGVAEALVVAVDGARLPRPRAAQAEVPLRRVAGNLLALVVDEDRSEAHV